MGIFDPAHTFLAEARAPAQNDLTDRSNHFGGPDYMECGKS